MAQLIRNGAVWLLFLMISMPVLAEETEEATEAQDLNDPFAIQGEAVLTHAELYSEFENIPAEYRLQFIRSGERVDQLVGSTLRYKLVALDGEKAGFDKDPVVRAKMNLAAQKALAEAWIRQVVEDAPDADYEALAYEYYLAHPEDYMTPEFVDITHILISSETRTPEEALEIATSLREELVASPELFEEYVMEYSDDPSKGSNGGNFGTMSRGQMVKPFEDAAFAMETEGEISEPVRTNYGYHLIKFNKRYPPRQRKYEDVKADAMAAAREEYLEEYRTRYIKKLAEDQIEVNRDDVERMAKRYFGENLELAPDFEAMRVE